MTDTERSDGTKPDPDSAVPDPRDTDHPAGEEHAKRNSEDEPPA